LHCNLESCRDCRVAKAEIAEGDGEVSAELQTAREVGHRALKVVESEDMIATRRWAVPQFTATEHR